MITCASQTQRKGGVNAGAQHKQFASGSITRASKSGFVLRPLVINRAFGPLGYFQSKLYPNHEMRKIMKLKYTIAALAVTTIAANAAVTATKDASAFSQYYLGNEIWDGAAYANGWDGAGASGGTTADYSLNGTNLLINQTTNNGWLQLNNGISAWEAMAATDSWTIEARIHVASVGGAASIWGAQVGAGAGIITANDNGVSAGAGTTIGLDTTDNTAGFHNFRIAYDQPNNVYNVWRDGALLTDTQGATLNTGLTRLIVGDCCSSTGGVGSIYEIEYAAYDVTGAFAPIPEPSSATLLGLGALALLRRRK